MKKNFLYKLLSACVLLAALLLWILTYFDVIKVPFDFTLHIFFIALIGGWGAINLLFGILTARKLYMYASGVLLCGAWVYIALLFTSLEWWIVLLIAAALLVAVYVLTILLTGGTSAITADNDKVGYKNYKKREAIEEKQEEKEEKERAKAVKKGEISEPKIRSFKDED